MATTHVLTSTEARTALPSIGDQIKQQGLGFKPVLFGSHRQAIGAIIPAALLDEIESLLEDIAIGKQTAPRLAEGPGDKTVAELAAELGLDGADFE
jgi:hypothetical protein